MNKLYQDHHYLKIWLLGIKVQLLCKAQPVSETSNLTISMVNQIFKVLIMSKIVVG